MNSSKTFRGGLLAATAAALLTAAPASAALPETATKCRAAVAKSYSKLVNTAVKTIAACHKARDKGDVLYTAVDCNDLLNDAAGVDPKGKYAKIALKNDSIIAASCTGVDDLLVQPDGTGPDYYVDCPVTCPGVPDGGLTTMTEVGKCLACEASALAGDVLEETLGLPAQGSQSAENQKCRGAIAKGYGKYLSTFLKGATTCQGGRDKTGVNALTECQLPANNDPKAKASGAITKAEAGLDKLCVGADLSVMDSCATDNLGNVKSCAAAAWDTAGDDAFSTTYELPAQICPTAIRTTIRGGCSTIGEAAGLCSRGSETASQLSVGWGGLGHGVDIVDAYTLAGDTSCPGPGKGSCGECTVTGPSLDNPQYAAFARCEDAPWTTCTNVFGTDAACGGGNCNYYLGPPLPISTGGTATCTMNVVTEPITGTADPDAGESDLLVKLRAIVITGESSSRPCPICRNDPTPQDFQLTGVCVGGNNAGTPCTQSSTCTGVNATCSGVGICLGGPRNGKSCDVQGFDLNFAPTNADNPTTGNSLDCPPSPGANISGDGLKITLPLTTGTSTKAAEDSCESPLGTLNCFCGVCSGDETVSCNTDQECADQALGTCGKGDLGAGIPRKPNSCSDGYCIPVMGQTDRGECSGGPQHCLDGPYVDTLCSDDVTCSICIGGNNDGNTCSGDNDCPAACVGGDTPGADCLSDLDCPGGGTCPDTCLGGSNDGTICTSDAECSGTCEGGTEDGSTCFMDGDCDGGGICVSVGRCAPKCDQHVCGEEEDVDKYCDGFVFANGRGVLPCIDNTTCNALSNNPSPTPSDWTCPGNDCGECTVEKFRSCFNDPIIISGTPDTENPVLAGTFCLPPSSNGGVNEATGSPGPGAVKIAATAEMRY